MTSLVWLFRDLWIVFRPAQKKNVFTSLSIVDRKSLFQSSDYVMWFFNAFYLFRDKEDEALLMPILNSHLLQSTSKLLKTLSIFAIWITDQLEVPIIVVIPK